MPIEFVTNRRCFFAATASSLVTNSLATTSLATAAPVDSALPSEQAAPKPIAGPVALLSDTHVAGNLSQRHRGINMADHLRQVIVDVNDALPVPSHVVLNGDCAYLQGRAEDYRTLGRLLGPLVEAGHSIHLMMGNHDDRSRCFESLQRLDRRSQVLDHKHVSCLQHEHADIYLLDSLDRVNHVAGHFGQPQLRWLRQQIASRPKRPAIVIGHHHLQTHRGLFSRQTGLKDSIEFEAILDASPSVAAYLYGHNHQWTQRATAGGCPTINLPTTAYVFDASEPQGWVLADIGERQVTLTLKTIDAAAKINNDMKVAPYDRA